MDGRPAQLPVGLQLSQAADAALQAAGGSLPVWLVLLNLKARPPANQRALAVVVGIREATLTHHLNSMERLGLISRHRDPDNRRIHVVGLTSAGEDTFLRLRDAAIAFNSRLTDGFSADERDRLGAALDRLVANVGEGDKPRAVDRKECHVEFG